MTSLFFSGLIAAAGLLIVYGAHQRWASLIDPSDSLWFCYTQSLWKVLVGQSGLVAVTYVQGMLLFMVGVYGLVNSVL